MGIGGLRRARKRKPTVVDVIDREWDDLDNDEQRLLFIIERRQLGRSTSDEYRQDLADWRRGMTLRERIRELRIPSGDGCAQ